MGQVATRTRRRALAALATGALATGALAAAAVGHVPAASASGLSAADRDPVVIAEGLDNPRQMAFGPRGALYVAEAGVGGDGPCVQLPPGEHCFGRTGAVTRISPEGVQKRILTRLPSLAEPGGSAALGASDISLRGRKISVSLGLGGDPAVRDQLPPAGQLLGHIVRRALRGAALKDIADVAGFEAINNPDGREEDSNPNSLKRTPQGYVVADAGANALLRVSSAGDVETLAVFDFLDLPGVGFPVAPVPTSVTRGPDGAFYVGQLTGFPFVEGAANILRVSRGGNVTVHASGLTNVVDLAFHGDTLYVVELAETGLLNGPVGQLLTIAPDGTQATVAGGLFAPFGLALHDDAAYVSTCAVCPDGGQVVRISLG